MSSLTSAIDFGRVPANIFNAVTRMMVYLSNPPSSSWVVRIAAIFRILALLLIVPCVFLTLLDVASYVIVRTLGADSAHRVSPTRTYGAAGIHIGSSFDSESNKPPKAPDLQSHIQVTETETGAETKLDPSPSSSSDSEQVPALSGEGLFSPPVSRASSPSILRHPQSTLNGDDTLRRRL
ncbi:hypothetical protein M422DRAFT_27829 [Sphaerobolus stellatus SS14]|nr:hypothetical protein M422DRAFT_27829 [Sphaerobolus stellatus SS14]